MKYFTYPLSGMRKEAAAWQRLWQTVGRPAAANMIKSIRNSVGGKYLSRSPLAKARARQSALMEGIKDTNGAYKDKLLATVGKINENRQKRHIQRIGDMRKQVMRAPTRENLDALTKLELQKPGVFKLKPFENVDSSTTRSYMKAPDTYPAEQILRDKKVWEDLSTFGRAFPNHLEGTVVIPKTSPILKEAYPYKNPYIK